MTTEEHIQILRDALKADHEGRIAEIEQWAEEATDAWHRNRHRDHAARLRAMPYPWDEKTTR